MDKIEINGFEKQDNRIDEILNYLEKISKKEILSDDKEEIKVSVKHITLLYFFESPNEKGIKMVDCSPKGSLSRFASASRIEENTLSKKSNTFIIKQDSILKVDWDNDINEVNSVGYLKKEEGNEEISYVVYTFVVSKEELKNIEKQINENESNSQGLVHIKVENLYDFEEEYHFYKELANKNKINEKKYDIDSTIIPKENINNDATLESREDNNISYVECPFDYYDDAGNLVYRAGEYITTKELEICRQNYSIKKLEDKEINVIKSIEIEENNLNQNINHVKNSKKTLLNFKKMLGKVFPINKEDSKNKIDCSEKSKGKFNI